jgi:MSHA biogenesis protein MshJ
MAAPAAFLKHFLALSLRERVLAVAAAVGVLFLLVEFAWVGPQQAQAKVLREQLARQTSETEALAQALASIAARPTADPLAAQRAERDELRKTIAQAESVIGRATADIRMGEVIRKLVAATPGLTLVSLKTVASQMLFKGSPAVAAAPPASGPRAPAAALPALPTLYKHGVEVAVKGRYASLLPYLQGLERNANGVFWSSVRLDAAQYPDLTLRMTLHTLSVQPELLLE